MKFGKSIVTDSLIFCIDYANKKSYIGSGVEVNDLVGNNTATLYNTTSPFDSDNGGFITLDGTNDYIQTNFNEFANPPFTVEIWFKSTNANQIGGLFSSRLGASNGYIQFSMFIAGDGNAAGAGNKFACYHRGNNGQRYGNISTTNVCDGNWHQGIVISDTTYNSIYIDGVYEDGSNALTNINVSYDTDYVIGALGNASSYVLPLDGSVSNIKYYNKVLSADEILQNYNALKDRFI